MRLAALFEEQDRLELTNIPVDCDYEVARAMLESVPLEKMDFYKDPILKLTHRRRPFDIDDLLTYNIKAHRLDWWAFIDPARSPSYYEHFYSKEKEVSGPFHVQSLPKLERLSQFVIVLRSSSR